MDWFIAFVIAGIVIFLLVSRKKAETAAPDQPSFHDTIKKDNDDFAGNSVGAFFLLEEIVDNRQNELNKDMEFFFADEILANAIDFDDEYYEDESFL